MIAKTFLSSYKEDTQKILKCTILKKFLGGLTLAKIVYLKMIKSPSIFLEVNLLLGLLFSRLPKYPENI